MTNSNYIFNDKVTPQIIPSPYDGSPMKPKIVTKTIGENKITEAHWYCPTTSRFVQKGTVSITPITPPKSE
tara:strand:- start:147 stop:359 length:213 start_codon:yes stop_codon:yes gene_type:complete